MKKNILFLLLFLQYTALLIGFEVHVVPLYKERLTGDWCGLFGRDAGATLWSAFKGKVNEHDDMLEIALNTLKTQTNGVYDLTYEKIAKKHSTLRLENGDYVYCFPVCHIPAPMLQKKMTQSLLQDCTKDSFTWVPVSQIKQHVTIRKNAYGKNMNYKFNEPTRMILIKNWDSKLKPELNAAVNRYTNEKYQAKKIVQKKLQEKELARARKNAQMALIQKADAQKERVHAAIKRNLKVAAKRSFKKA